MTRPELLEKLYQKFWNEVAMLESDLPGYAYIGYDDLSELDEICEQIEAIE